MARYRDIPRYPEFLSPTAIAQQDASRLHPNITPERTIVRHAEAVPRLECFPLETLDSESMAHSAELLLAALDREPLYTLVSGIKPVSEGFWSSRFRVSPQKQRRSKRYRKRCRHGGAVCLPSGHDLCSKI